MKSNKIKQETNSLFSLIIIIVILAIIGIFSEGYFHSRIDLTEDKQFTLSNAAVKTLENLPDLITIKAVFSSELPTQFVQIKTHITDLLGEFKQRAGGKLQLVYMDPGEDEEKKKQVTSLGIQEVQLQEQSNQGLEIKKGFFGLAITYGDKKEVIPVISNLQTFEYDLIVKIKKLTGAVKKIGIIEGGEGNQYSFSLPGNPPQTKTGFDENFPSLKEQLEKLYTLQKTDISQGDIPNDVEMLIVAAPKNVSEVEKYRMDQFLMQGKSILFMTPGVDVNLSMGLSGTATNNGYEDLLSHYGVAVKKNVMLEDRNFQHVPFGNSFFPTPYPFWIIAIGEQLNMDNAITSKVGQITLPWASSLNIDSTKLDSSSSLVILANSTEGSWEESGRFNLLPRDLKDYLPVQQGSQPLIALKTAKFKSFYANRDIPADSANPLNEAALKKEAEVEGRILVVGNALFATDFYMGLMRAGHNLNFILNAVDQLALDPDLIKIRSREIENRPIPEDKKANKLSYVIANMLIAPIILLAIGIGFGIRRKKRDAAA